MNWLNIFYAVEWAIFAGFAFLPLVPAGEGRLGRKEAGACGPTVDRLTASPTRTATAAVAPPTDRKLALMPPAAQTCDLPRIRGALRLYQVCSIITGVMLLLLCAEMLVKYALRVRARSSAARSASCGSPPGRRRRVTVTGDEPVARHPDRARLVLRVYLFCVFRAVEPDALAVRPLHAARARRHRPVPLLLPRGARGPRRQGYLARREAAELPSRAEALADPSDPDETSAATQTETARAGARRRLRRAVRPADRPPRARGGRLQRDRPAHGITAAEIAAKNPRRHHPLAAVRPSVYEPGAPQLDPGVFDLGVPTLGICYGFQVMAQALGGEVANTGLREYGATDAALTGDGGVLLGGQPAAQNVWMSHGDSGLAGAGGLRRARLERVHPGRRVRRATSGACTACSGTPRSSTPTSASGCSRTSCTSAAGHPRRLEQRQRHRRAGRRASAPRSASGRVICGLSGGVDSAVAAALVHEAVGDQLTCVFVDHGLLRKDEREQVEKDYVASTGVRLVTIDAREQFLDRARRRQRPRAEAQDHRPGVHPLASSGASADLVAEAAADGEPIRFLVQGTLYPDVVESGGGTGTANIKSPPQRRRPARRPAVRARRAAAHPVQGRGARDRPRARPARR